jgi:hypothetical protein
LDGIPFHTISEEEAEWVERAFEDMEVFEVVKDTNRDKDSGLDGFLWHSSMLFGILSK